MPIEAAYTVPTAEATRSRQATARLAFGAGVVLLALWTFAEYLPALGWAGVIAIATWPFYKRLARALRRGRAGARAAGVVRRSRSGSCSWRRSSAPAGCSATRRRRRSIGSTRRATTASRRPTGSISSNMSARRSPIGGATTSPIRRAPPNWRNGFDKAPLIAMSEHIGALAGRRLVVFLFTILALFFLYRDGDSLAVSLGRLSERAFGPRGRAIGERIVNLGARHGRRAGAGRPWRRPRADDRLLFRRRAADAAAGRRDRHWRDHSVRRLRDVFDRRDPAGLQGRDRSAPCSSSCWAWRC